MSFYSSVKGKVDFAKAKVKKFNADLDVKRQEREKTVDLKRKLDYESSKDYLKKDEERKMQESVIKKAGDVKKENSFINKSSKFAKSLYNGLENTSKVTSKVSKNVASASGKSFVSQRNVLGGSVDKNILRFKK